MFLLLKKGFTKTKIYIRKLVYPVKVIRSFFYINEMPKRILN